jgi:uncharacterized MAPEG superfamily protein
MTIAEWCLFGSVLLNIGSLAPAKAAGFREYDNADPRNPRFYKHPLRKRAWGAHQNGLEAFPFFAAAVLLAELRQAPQGWIDGLALVFLALRTAYVLAYVGDRATLRSLIWTTAFLVNVGLFLLPALSG